jgi:hypothetical protein
MKPLNDEKQNSQRAKLKAHPSKIPPEKDGTTVTQRTPSASLHLNGVKHAGIVSSLSVIVEDSTAPASFVAANFAGMFSKPA